MEWNNMKHLPKINGVTLYAGDQMNGNFTLESLGMIPMSDLGINEIFRSVMGYQYVPANRFNPEPIDRIREVKLDD